MRLKVRRTMPNEVSDVFHHEAIAVDCRGDGARNIRRPVTIIRLLDHGPPDDNDDDRGCVDNENPPTPCRPQTAGGKKGQSEHGTADQSRIADTAPEPKRE